MADATPAGQEQNKQKRLSGSDRVPAVSAEDTSIREGTVRYDIHFRVCVPGTERESVEIIMNVEVQNSDLPGYPIPKRAVYYVARLISAQRGEVFQDQEYEKIKKSAASQRTAFDGDDSRGKEKDTVRRVLYRYDGGTRSGGEQHVQSE